MFRDPWGQRPVEIRKQGTFTIEKSTKDLALLKQITNERTTVLISFMDLNN